MMKKQISFLCVVLLIGCFVSACGNRQLADGTYQINVTLTGGTGRASVNSPATVVIAGSSKTATIIWSSPYYEFMLVDGVQYDPVQEEGNSTFEIPVELDQEIPVSAQTIAMSEPHLIDYTLYFDSSTAKGA